MIYQMQLNNFICSPANFEVCGLPMWLLLCLVTKWIIEFHVHCYSYLFFFFLLNVLSFIRTDITFEILLHNNFTTTLKYKLLSISNHDVISYYVTNKVSLNVLRLSHGRQRKSCAIYSTLEIFISCMSYKNKK